MPDSAPAHESGPVLAALCTGNLQYAARQLRANRSSGPQSVCRNAVPQPCGHPDVPLTPQRPNCVSPPGLFPRSLDSSHEWMLSSFFSSVSSFSFKSRNPSTLEDRLARLRVGPQHLPAPHTYVPCIMPHACIGLYYFCPRARPPPPPPPFRVTAIHFWG